MSNQVAVRLTDDLLASLDWLVIRCDYENRAEAIRAALAAATKQERDREIDEQIRRAYQRMPETSSEHVTADLSVWDDLDDEDWSTWR